MRYRVSSSLIFLATIALLLGSCKQEEDTKRGVSGHVSAPEGRSTEGAIVRLYPAPLPFEDASVWSVPNQQLGVGFDYSLEFTFDPRTERPLVGTDNSYVADTLDAGGDFQFEGIIAGDYVIAAAHPDGGWTTPKLISTSGGDVDAGTLELPPVVIYEQVTVLSENTTWESGTTYVARGNMFVDAGVTLTIEPGAVVCLAGNKAINVEGTLVCRGAPDNFIIFACADVISRDPDEWLHLRFLDGATPPDIAYCAFRNGSTGVNSDAQGGVVEYCHFNRFVNEGVLALSQPPVVNRCVFDRTAVGFRAAATSDILVQHNVFQTCDPFAIMLDTDQDNTEIFCNWFRDCGGSDTSGSGDRGVIKMDWISDCEVHQNMFETSWYAFQMGSKVDSTTYIHHNQFYRMNRCFNINVTEERRDASYPLIRYNCFATIDNFIQFVHCNQHNDRDMYSTDNYWGTTSLTRINDDYVHDHQDDPSCPTVYIEPIRVSCQEINTLTGIVPGVCE
ncbi:hypothetical protein IT157_02020 [bacterium]|nr:hypothetical protein [bacterium]